MTPYWAAGSVVLTVETRGVEKAGRVPSGKNDHRRARVRARRRQKGEAPRVRPERPRSVGDGIPSHRPHRSPVGAIPLVEPGCGVSEIRQFRRNLRHMAAPKQGPVSAVRAAAFSPKRGTAASWPDLRGQRDDPGVRQPATPPQLEPDAPKPVTAP
jgi:hypothetical protein